MRFLLLAAFILGGCAGEGGEMAPITTGDGATTDVDPAMLPECMGFVIDEGGTTGHTTCVTDDPQELCGQCRGHFETFQPERIIICNVEKNCRAR